MESEEHEPGDLPILAPIYKPTRIGGVAISSYYHSEIYDR